MAQAVSPSLPFGGSRDVPPMSEMNTTPLIDVMLVLLIMFIITVPMQTHEISMNLPKGGTTVPIRLKNDLAMDGMGRLAWNGTAVSDAQLVGLMAEVASRAEQPESSFPSGCGGALCPRRPGAGDRSEERGEQLRLRRQRAIYQSLLTHLR